MMEQKMYKIDDKFFYSQIPYRRYLKISRYHKSHTQWSEKEDLELLKSSYTNDKDNGTNDTAPTFKAFDEGSNTLSKEDNAVLASRQEKFIISLQNALIRIKNKTYGVCRKTGKLISKKRLILVPHATLSIEAKEKQ